MRRSIFACFAAIACVAVADRCLADKPILLVTPKGVFVAEVADGLPGPWKPAPYDVIIQGFGCGPTPLPGPQPDPAPPTDSETQQVAAVSRKLASKNEGIAVAAIVDSLSRAGLKGAALVDALSLSAPLADTSLKSDGRIIAWVKAATAITSDGSKLLAGVRSAWSIDAGTLQTIRSEAQRPAGDAVSDEALDFAAIIQIITMILELLTKLGII